MIQGGRTMSKAISEILRNSVLVPSHNSSIAYYKIQASSSKQWFLKSNILTQYNPKTYQYDTYLLRNDSRKMQSINFPLIDPFYFCKSKTLYVSKNTEIHDIQ